MERCAGSRVQCAIFSGNSLSALPARGEREEERTRDASQVARTSLAQITEGPVGQCVQMSGRNVLLKLSVRRGGIKLGEPVAESQKLLTGKFADGGFNLADGTHARRIIQHGLRGKPPAAVFLPGSGPGARERLLGWPVSLGQSRSSRIKVVTRIYANMTMLMEIPMFSPIFTSSRWLRKGLVCGSEHKGPVGSGRFGEELGKCDFISVFIDRPGVLA